MLLSSRPEVTPMIDYNEIEEIPTDSDLQATVEAQRGSNRPGTIIHIGGVCNPGCWYDVSTARPRAVDVASAWWAGVERKPWTTPGTSSARSVDAFSRSTGSCSSASVTPTRH